MLEYVRLEIILSLNQLSINLFWQNSLLALDQNSLLGLVSSHLAMFGTARILLSKLWGWVQQLIVLAHELCKVDKLQEVKLRPSKCVASKELSTSSSEHLLYPEKPLRHSIAQNLFHLLLLLGRIFHKEGQVNRLLHVINHVHNLVCLGIF